MKVKVSTIINNAKYFKAFVKFTITKSIRFKPDDHDSNEILKCYKLFFKKNIKK